MDRTSAMHVPLIDLQAQYLGAKTEIDTAITEVISESAFIKGRFVSQFENNFAQFLGSKHCVGCANGTDAIEIVLRALNIGAGDEVIVPVNTWISTSEAVSSVGAKPVFVDCHPQTHTVDISLLEQSLSPRSKAIIPVHLYGLPADMRSIMEFSRRHSLFVIEDCAQAHGARYQGQMVGTFGTASTFSFFPSKNLGAFGDAGCIVTNDTALAESCRRIGDHGRLGKSDHALEGRNSRLDGLQAAILCAKLPHLNAWNSARKAHARLYYDLLKGSPLQLPTADPEYDHVYHLFVVQVEDRPALQASLTRSGVSTGIHYPVPLHMLKAYDYMGHNAEDFPVGHQRSERILSLPMYPELSEAQIHYVVQAIFREIDSTRSHP